MDGAAGALVGRARERGVVDAAVHAARDGVGRVLLVSGSRVLARRGSPGGRPVWRRRPACAGGGASEDEGSPPYWPFRQAMRGVDGIGRVVFDVTLPDRRAETVAQERFRLFEAVADVLRAAAEPAGLLLVLDDMQWADPASLGLLVHLARGLAGSRLFVVVNYRDTETSGRQPLLTALAALTREATVARLHLDGLSEPEVAEQLAQVPGATILPGLVDGHVHLMFDASDDPVGQLAARDDAAPFATLAGAARRAAQGGVTTVRDLGGRGFLVLGLRDAARTDTTLPHILAAGPPITTPGGHCHFLGASAAGADGIREAVRERADRGADVIKIMASGGNMTPGSRPELAQYTRDELRAAVTEAHRHDLAITAHAHGTSAITDAVAAGMDGLEHATFMTADGVDKIPGELLAALGRGEPVLSLTFGIAPAPGAGPPPGVLARMPALIANAQRMYHAGARIIVGSDAGLGPAKPPDAVRYALPQLLQIGMSPAEALHTCTARAASALSLGDRKGRIARIRRRHPGRQRQPPDRPGRHPPDPRCLPARHRTAGRQAVTAGTPPDGGHMTTPHNVQRPSGGGTGGHAVPCIAGCPDPDCSAPAEVYAELALDSTHGPVRHARTFCLNRHFYQLPVEYIPGMPAPPGPAR